MKNQNRTASLKSKVKKVGLSNELRQSSTKVKAHVKQPSISNMAGANSTGKSIRIQKIKPADKNEEQLYAFQQQIAANKSAIKNLTENLFKSSPEKKY